MIKLIKLIELAGVRLEDFKIHCATQGSGGSSPLDAFFDGSFQAWQEQQNQENFKCQQIVSLIHLGGSRWLFAGVYKVLKVKPGNWKARCFKYSTKELDGLGHLTGRAIVDFKKDFRASYLRGEKFRDRLIVDEIRRQRMAIGKFPGFKKVLLTHANLNTLIRTAVSSWQEVLSSVAGVYVITDLSSGKQYVGSAYGGEGIWQRWADYAKTGHGGNKELRELLRDEGADHARQFQFSLLEVCDLDASDDYVIERETHWKNVLQTRKFGLNKN